MSWGIGLEGGSLRRFSEEGNTRDDATICAASSSGISCGPAIFGAIRKTKQYRLAHVLRFCTVTPQAWQKPQVTDLHVREITPLSKNLQQRLPVFMTRRLRIVTTTQTKRVITIERAYTVAGFDLINIRN